MKIRRQFNPDYKGATGEVNNLPSMTQPDMSLTILQLLTNHSRGIHSDVYAQEPQYFDTEIPQINDITELIEHREKLREKLSEAKTAAYNEVKAKKAPKPQEPAKPDKKPIPVSPVAPNEKSVESST